MHSTYWSAVAWSAVVGKPLLRDPSVALLETTPLSHVILLSRRSFHSHRSLHYVDSDVFHHVRLVSAEAADDTRTRPLGRSTTRSNCATTTTTRCLRVSRFHNYLTQLSYHNAPTISRFAVSTSLHRASCQPAILVADGDAQTFVAATWPCRCRVPATRRESRSMNYERMTGSIAAPASAPARLSMYVKTNEPCTTASSSDLLLAIAIADTS